jgi:hypothetical protein
MVPLACTTEKRICSRSSYGKVINEAGISYKERRYVSEVVIECVRIYIQLYKTKEIFDEGCDRTVTELCKCDEAPMMCPVVLSAGESDGRGNRNFRLSAPIVVINLRTS